MKFEKREYPEFAGKLVTYIDENINCAGMVVSCDYHIGCTIVSEFNHKEYLLCCIGPQATSVKGHRQMYRGQDDIDEWDQIFQKVVDDITAGVVDETNNISIMPASEDTCPFT